MSADFKENGLSPELVRKVEQWQLSWPEYAPKIGKAMEEGIAFWLRNARYRGRHHSWEWLMISR
jgi:hypothetical protein